MSDYIIIIIIMVIVIIIKLILHMNTHYIKALKYISLLCDDAEYTGYILFICHNSEALSPCFKDFLTSSYTFSCA